MNTTESIVQDLIPLSNYYLVCALSTFALIVTVMVATAILILVHRTKPRLHTIRHLLICNTCIATIIYCIVQTNNYIFLFFLCDLTSDRLCRLRGYLGYVSICGIAYSYFLQAISRLMVTMFSSKFKSFATFRAHYILITLQWILVIILPLPSLLTKDIYFRPSKLCWVPMTALLHVAYTYLSSYIIPGSSICGVYVFIYCRVNSFARNAIMISKRLRNDRRDVELLRNIITLLLIYFLGGVPSILFLITKSSTMFLGSIASISMSIAFEKVFTIILDRDLRQSVIQLWASSSRVMPMHATVRLRKSSHKF